MITYYEILEVSRMASKEVITKAYKVLVRKYHPDLEQDETKKEEAKEKMVKINEAYETLSDDIKREKYDIQPYAKTGNDYIYQVKVFDDILETGLTNDIFSFTDTKMVIKNKDGKIGLNIRGYIGKFNSARIL